MLQGRTAHTVDLESLVALHHPPIRFHHPLTNATLKVLYIIFLRERVPGDCSLKVQDLGFFCKSWFLDPWTDPIGDLLRIPCKDGCIYASMTTIWTPMVPDMC